MKGYKVFNPDWTCRGFQYEVGKVYEIAAEPIICEKGFHFCKKLQDCFNYYGFNPNNRVAIVEALGEISQEDDKIRTNKIKICEELTWIEVLEMVNTGDYNSGRLNSGHYNSGHCNSGHRNSGHHNSGYGNSGYWNSGHHNSGHWNSGDYNVTNHSSGCFNTVEATIVLFNKNSTWTYNDWLVSEARGILCKMPTRDLIWISEIEMSEEKKAKYPEYKTTGGVLREVNAGDERQKWWDELSLDDKETIFALPNFDANIFEQCTGIKIK